VPLYEFRCPVCDGLTEQLLPLGDTAPRPCLTEDCPGTRFLKLSRVAVSYQAFGFTKTDTLVSDPEGKNFRSLQDKANEISET
jgi:predicted nucleic acid-binding Zn ribbon protein